MENKFKTKKLRGLLIGLMAGIFLWFISVDSVVYLDACPDCGFKRYGRQIRIFHYPIHDYYQTYDTMIRKEAEDLGVPCIHPHTTRSICQRLQGLFWTIGKTEGGMFGIGGWQEWYDTNMSSKVRELTRRQPDAANEFRTNVLVNHNHDFLHEFNNQLLDPKRSETNGR